MSPMMRHKCGRSWEGRLARDQRRLAAIVSADVVGYSLLMGRDESATLAALKAHRRELIDPKIAEYGGRIVKTTGDGLLLEFPSVVDAVRCAVDVQRGMAERNAGVSRRSSESSFVSASTSATSSSMETTSRGRRQCRGATGTLAEPGGICVSRVVRDQVLDKLSFTFEDLGRRKSRTSPARSRCTGWTWEPGAANSKPRRRRLTRISGRDRSWEPLSP